MTEITQDTTTLVSPIWRVVLKGAKGDEDLTSTLSHRLISLSLTDKKGTESDDLSIELDDPDGDLDLPPTKALLSVSLGWKGQGLIDKGLFRVDEIDYSWSPRRLTIQAKGAPVSQALGERKERSWHGKTLGEIATTIAKEHSLTPMVSKLLQGVAIEHIDQTNESDINFLTRIAKLNDAICTVKSERLLLSPVAACTSVSGTPIADQVIVISDQDSGRYHSDDRSRYSGVKAYWHDPGASRRKSVLAGSTGQVKSLRPTHPNKDEAEKAAKAELKRIKRGSGTLSLNLDKGRPTLMPETPFRVRGVKPEIDAERWVIKTIKHSLDGNGYTCSIEAEQRG